MKKYYINNKKGSSTIESCILFPVILGVVLLIVFLTIIVFEWVMLINAASNASHRAADEWNSNQSLYSNIYDSDEEEKIKNTEEYASLLSDRAAILKRSDSEVLVSVDKDLMHKEIKVRIIKTYRLPDVSLLSLFGLKSSFKVDVRSSSRVRSPVRLIRDLDYIYENIKNIKSIATGGW